MVLTGTTCINIRKEKYIFIMFNLNRYLESLKGEEVIVKTRFGMVKAVIEDVGRNGTLLVSNYRRIVEGEEIEKRDLAIIRGDNIIAILMEKT